MSDAYLTLIEKFHTVSHMYVNMKYGYSESNQREFETPNRTSPV